ncbi:hypothetical protein [Thermoactinospora rubra]|uniref:hypothetical protein n=1 Tax=Thermoactinospora rubra TaxID=1088767 RepID=UPI000A10B0AD|nr:hypothetical protein [Thermoactinospora rubra]
MRRLLVLLALLTPLVAPAAPAQAGGWAVTSLDPVPGRFEPGTAYTLGSWLLQHGNHPYWGDERDLKVGLRFTDGKRTLTFDAVKLREPAHYATAVALPKGTWRVIAVQEWFAPHDLGTVTVPGSFTPAPPPQGAKEAAATWLAANNGKDPWGDIRPPAIPKAAPGTAAPAAPGATTAPAAAPAAAVPGAAVPGAEEVTTAAVDYAAPWWLSPSALGLVALAGAAVALLAVRRRRARQKV